MGPVYGVKKLFVRTDRGSIRIISAKVIDEFMVAVPTEDIQELFKEFSAEFEVGKTEIGEVFSIKGW